MALRLGLGEYATAFSASITLRRHGRRLDGRDLARLRRRRRSSGASAGGRRRDARPRARRRAGRHARRHAGVAVDGLLGGRIAASRAPRWIVVRRGSTRHLHFTCVWRARRRRRLRRHAVQRHRSGSVRRAPARAVGASSAVGAPFRGTRRLWRQPRRLSPIDAGAIATLSSSRGCTCSTRGSVRWDLRRSHLHFHGLATWWRWWLRRLGVTLRGLVVAHPIRARFPRDRVHRRRRAGERVGLPWDARDARRRQHRRWWSPVNGRAPTAPLRVRSWWGAFPVRRRITALSESPCPRRSHAPVRSPDDRVRRFRTRTRHATLPENSLLNLRRHPELRRHIAAERAQDGRPPTSSWLRSARRRDRAASATSRMKQRRPRFRLLRRTSAGPWPSTHRIRSAHDSRLSSQPVGDATRRGSPGR